MNSIEAKARAFDFFRSQIEGGALIVGASRPDIPEILNLQNVCLLSDLDALLSTFEPLHPSGLKIGDRVLLTGDAWAGEHAEEYPDLAGSEVTITGFDGEDFTFETSDDRVWYIEPQYGYDVTKVDESVASA